MAAEIVILKRDNQDLRAENDRLVEELRRLTSILEEKLTK